MSDKKISQLTNATTPLDGTEQVPIVQGGNTVKTSVSELSANKVPLIASTDNAVARFNGTGGELQDSNVHISDTGAISVNGNVVLTVENSANSVYLGGGATTPSECWLQASNLATIYVNGAQRVVVDSSGNTNVKTGNLVIGTSGKGIDFSADGQASGMTSELLDDYEEGTWTPQYTNTAPPTTPYTMSIFSATYTKVGRQVTLRAYIATSSVDITGASGELSISGLPFAPASGNAAYSAACVAEVLNWTTYPCFGYVAGDSKLYLEKRAAANGASANMTAADLVAGATANQNMLMVTTTYFTA